MEIPLQKALTHKSHKEKSDKLYKCKREVIVNTVSRIIVNWQHAKQTRTLQTYKFYSDI